MTTAGSVALGRPYGVPSRERVLRVVVVDVRWSMVILTDFRTRSTLPQTNSVLLLSCQDHQTRCCVTPMSRTVAATGVWEGLVEKYRNWPVGGSTWRQSRFCAATPLHRPFGVLGIRQTNVGVAVAASCASTRRTSSAGPGAAHRASSAPKMIAAQNAAGRPASITPTTAPHAPQGRRAASIDIAFRL